MPCNADHTRGSEARAPAPRPDPAVLSMTRVADSGTAVSRARDLAASAEAACLGSANKPGGECVWRIRVLERELTDAIVERARTTAKAKCLLGDAPPDACKGWEL